MTRSHTSVELDLNAALAAVRSLVPPTPLVRAPDLDERAGGRPVWLKLESLQATGSFKVRGAAAHLLGLTEPRRARGVVTCSSGNHGRAVAFVAERLGVPATVCLPRWVDPVKLEAIEGHGADARLAGETYDEVEVHARALADEHGWVFVPSFDDEAVAAGQASIALELLDALPELDGGGEVAIPLSGGGLAGGMAYALAERAPRVRVSAVSARRARVMWESLEAGGPVELPEEETLASALAGGIGLDNRVTFDLVRAFVHRHVLIDEPAIVRAVAAAYRRGLVVEGGGAVALAALLEGALAVAPEAARTSSESSAASAAAGASAASAPLVVVVSGGNLDPQVLARLLAGV